MSEEKSILVVNRSDLIYTSCYCEENVWKLCQYIDEKSKRDLNDCRVVFISNDNKTIPLWKQRAGKEDRDYLCVWDYHVSAFPLWN